MRKRDHEAALGAFSRSYDAVRSPNSQLMIGRMLVELGRYGEAWDALRQAEREAAEAAEKDKKYEQTMHAASAELEELRKLAGFVVVKGAARGDRVVIDGREQKDEEWASPRAVKPGSVSVELISASGGRTARNTSVDAGATVEVDLSRRTRPVPAKAEPAPAETSISTRTLAYVAGGIGAAGIVTFVAFGTLNHLTWSELGDACTRHVCPRRFEDDADAGQAYQTIANVGLLVGVVGATAGVTLWMLSDDRSGEKPVEKAQLSVGPASVSVRGRF